jgi:hypothetical protein
MYVLLFLLFILWLCQQLLYVALDGKVITEELIGNDWEGSGVT